MSSDNENAVGHVYLVGAGPGDPDLITVRGRELLDSCDAVVYDKLIPQELVVSLKPRIEQHYVGKMPGHHTVSQKKINELLVALAQQGKRVVRLKGGDPFVFGRGGEEASHLIEHGIRFSVVPGVTAGTAGPAYAGIPVTYRGKANQVIFVTGHEAPDIDGHAVPWSWLARMECATLVGYMGVGQLPLIVDTLIQNGLDPQTPAALVERATVGTQCTVSAPLVNLPRAAEQNSIKPPALFVIGDVATLTATLSWFDRLPLFGLRVMVVRPPDQTRRLCRQLRELGADVLALPTLYFAAEFDRRDWARIHARTQPGDWLYFASYNGVQYFFESWCRQGCDLRQLAKFKIATVGAGAHRALVAQRITPDLQASTPTTSGLARELAALPDISTKRVVRVRGTVGKTDVDEILRAANAEVIPLVVYRSMPAQWGEKEYEKFDQTRPDVILLSSGSAATALANLIGEQRINEINQQAKIISIGPTTTRTAEQAGLKITAEAHSPSLDSLVETLVEKFGKTSQS